MRSALASGRVWHWRREPKPHRFDYALYYSLIDLDQVEALFSGSRLWSIEQLNMVSFRRRDYLGPDDRPLAQAVRERVKEETGVAPAGRIMLLTHLRQWGFCFNPVSFYFCLDETDRLAFIVAEIHNTPWGERHAYVLDCRGQPGPEYRFVFAKAFHVSPFLPMDIDYDWRFLIRPEHIGLHMVLKRDGRECFSAGMQLKLQPWTPKTMRRMPLIFPLITFKVITGIYWQALRLWLKKTPFNPHPKKVST